MYPGDIRLTLNHGNSNFLAFEDIDDSVDLVCTFYMKPAQFNIRNVADNHH